ncbi:hypothetical protein D3C72_2567020 [compost metagenome]
MTVLALPSAEPISVPTMVAVAPQAARRFFTSCAMPRLVILSPIMRIEGAAAGIGFGA